MTRVRALIVCSGLAACLGLGLMTRPAQGMPPIFERVPDDAMLVFTIPNPESLQKHIGELNAAIDSPFPVPSVEDLLSMSGMNAGVDTSRPIAVVVFAPTPNEIKAKAERMKKAASGGEDRDEIEVFSANAEDKVVTLIAVKNYSEFLAGLGVEKPEEGAPSHAVTLPGGESGFARDVGGGYAVLGASKSLVENFSPKTGATPLAKRIGKPGEKLADEADIVAVFNMEQMRPLIPEAISEMRKGAREQAEMMGADPAAAEKNVESIVWFIESVARDADGMVGGMKFSAKGIGADMNANFREGTQFAKAFASAGSPGALLSKLPSMPFIIAGAMDMSNADMKTLFREFTSRAPSPGGDNGMQSMLAGIENAKGTAMVMGFPMGGAIAGLLTSSMTYSEAADPAAAVALAKQTMLAMDGLNQNGVKFKVTYTDGGAKVGTTPVDVWDMKMDVGADDQGQMAAQGMAFIFGPQGGPGGYIAKSDSGVYTTFAKNSDLMSKALAAGKGDGERLESESSLRQTASNLPPARIAEAYLGTKSIMDLVLPFAGMMGVQVPMDKIPAQLPPIGFAIASDAGQARFSTFVPAEVLKTTSLVGQEIMEQFQNFGGEPMGENPDDGPGGNGKSGQPRF